MSTILTSAVYAKWTRLKAECVDWDWHWDSCATCQSGKWDECEKGRKRKAAVLTACDAIRDALLRMMPGMGQIVPGSEVTRPPGSK